MVEASTQTIICSAADPAPLTGFLRAFRQHHEFMIDHVRSMDRGAREDRAETYAWALAELGDGEHPAVLLSNLIERAQVLREESPSGDPLADEQLGHEIDGHVDAAECAIEDRPLDGSRPAFSPHNGTSLWLAFDFDRTFRSWPTPDDVREILGRGLPPLPPGESDAEASP